MLQAWQEPQASTPQQTPSAHWPLPHSASAAQALPSGFVLPHWPAVQVVPAAQSPSPLQADLQVPLTPSQA